MKTQLTITPQQKNVEAGQPVMFAISLKNVSDKQVLFEHTKPFSVYNNDFVVEVLDAGKKEAHPTKFLADLKTFNLDKSISWSMSITLEPDQSVEALINVARFFDMTMPGKYFVTLQTAIQKTASVSNTVEISVVEPRSKYVIKDEKKDQKKSE